MAGLARFDIRFRYVIIAFWVIAGALCLAFFPSLSSAVNTDNSSFLPGSSPSVHALHLAAPFQPVNDTTGTLVVLGKSKLSSSEQQAITKLQNKIAKDDHVVSVSDQGLSKDGKVSKAQLVLDVQTSSTDASPTVAAIRGTMSSFNLPSELSSYLTGQLPSAVDNQNSQASAQKLTANLSVLIILVMLIIVFRAVAAPLVTLVPAIWVLLMSGSIIAEASKAGLQVSTITQTMLTVLLLGAGTDYGVFFIMRVREEMGDGASPHTAIERAGRYIGESITFSAGTVIAALLTLLLAMFGLYSGLGPALALGVFLMLLAALTLLPALLAVLGRALFWPRSVRPAKGEGAYARLADVVIAHPVITLVGGVVFLAALGVFTLGYTSSGFGGQATGPSGSQSAHGTNVINKHYPQAVANPTQVLMVYRTSVWKNLTPASNAESQLAKKPVFSSVSGPFDPNGTKLSTSQLSSLYTQLGPPGKLPATEPADTPVPAQTYALYRAESQFVSPDGKTVQFYTSLSAGAPASTAALNATPAVRSAVTSVQHSVGATDSGTAGLAPASYDVSTVSQSDLKTIVPVVIVLLALLLGLLLRSIIAPLYLVATVLLSYFAALGLAVLVFQVGAGDSGLNFVLPFLLFVFLMALGEDYNILVMTRIREEAHQAPLREAVRTAAHHTGTTVTSAGLILAATFGVAGVTGATSQIKQLGTAIALGVLIDTFLVRTLMVPAIVVLCRRWNWWPSKLSRREAQIPAVRAGAGVKALSGSRRAKAARLPVRVPAYGGRCRTGSPLVCAAGPARRAGAASGPRSGAAHRLRRRGSTRSR
jgi:putative drug exporter of the RND superfamily